MNKYELALVVSANVEDEVRIGFAASLGYFLLSVAVVLVCFHVTQLQVVDDDTVTFSFTL